MATKVSLKELVEELQAQCDESFVYIRINTGEIVSFTSNDLNIIENDENWRKREPMEVDYLTKVYAVLNTDDYRKLPNKFDIHEYNIMRDFCYEFPDERIKHILVEKIHGSGAFRRFNDAVYHLDIQDKWFQYLNQAYKQIAIDWLEEHGFEYIDDMNP